MSKGQSVLGYKGIYFIAAMFLLAFIFLYMHSAFANYQTGKIQCTKSSVQEIMIAKVLYGPCVTYTDPQTQQSIPGTIDISKFTNETLDTCFSFITEKMKLTLNEKRVGDSIYDPYYMNKTIWVYDGEKKENSILQFTFEEPPC
ncbi:hypothetical protein EXS74_02745 [Candidatus Woesearchaeota archaeon]|nr:hypothetical protein [Candidatus Woesearchaeota archaeon]